MKIAVWDTYVDRKDGQGLMHFDILVPEGFEDRTAIKAFGNEYLEDKDFETESLALEKCLFCHVENAPIHISEGIRRYGYVVVELSNCD